MDNRYYNPEIWGGIECTINRVKHEFFDQLEYAGHYKREEDIERIAELGIRKMRYPILWEKHQPDKDSDIDWAWTESRLNLLREKNIDVIAGLVHHGSGPSFTHLGDPQFPYLLAAYAKKVAERFPWINYYTPVNEPLTTARFSGLYGLWYPHQRNTRGFVHMLLNELKGTVLAMKEIRKINPTAQLVQTEDLGKIYSTPKLQYQARYENERRWLTWDLLCGKFDSSHKLWKHFRRLLVPEEDLQFFLDNPCPPDIFGFNHYLTSERFLDERLHLYPDHTHGGNVRHRYADVEAVRVEMEEETGIEVLLKEAWDRYGKPLAVTEVHLHCHREEQIRWFKHVWEACKSLVSQGVDIRAVTSWALLGSFGWNRLLTIPNGDYEPGAFDLRGGKLRTTALAHFIRDINHTRECRHPLSIERGWWQRSSRILYGPVIKELRMKSSVASAPLLIVGKNGTLGRAFARVCEERCIAYRILGREECDITNPDQIQAVIDYFRPWAIINAAGYVQVDKAENDPGACFESNTAGPLNLAIACKKTGVQLLTFSSDLVFDGTKNKPYTETDLPNALNIYGKSKRESEILVQLENPSSLIIRTSAFFGPWDEYNFAHYVQKCLQQGEPVYIAKDIFVSPTYVPDLVHASLDVLIDRESGIWHLSNDGQVSWAQFAYLIAEGFDCDKSLLHPVFASELNYAAKRPLYSALSSERGQLLPTLDNALSRYLHEQKREKRQVA